MTGIGEKAFENCKLNEIYFTGALEQWVNKQWYPYQVTSEKYTLYIKDKKATDVVIPDKITEIKNSAFYNCSSLTSVTIPKNVTSISGYAFAGCSGLTAAAIPASVTTIGTAAFINCTGLTSVTIPENVTSIGQGGTFQNCTSLASVQWNAMKCTIEKNEEYKYYPPFLNSVNIKDFTISNKVESVPACLCEGLSALTSVIIPNSVTTIEEYAFAGCTALASVTFGNNVATIGEDAFNNCPSLADIVWNVKKYRQEESGYYSSPFYSISSQITSFTFGDDVEEIPAYLCNGMSKLTAVTIGKNVKAVGSGAFSYCESLAAVHISDLSAWCRIEFDYDTSNPLYYARHLYTNGKEITGLVIPDDVTAVGSYAFVNCADLASVTIGKSVTSIGANAFSGCSGLTSVIWNAVNYENADSEYNQSPFKNLASQITSFVFGGKVETIPACICSEMANLASVTIPDKVAAIGEGVFSNCEALTAVHISDLAAWCRIAFEGGNWYGDKTNPLAYAHHLYLNGDEIKELEIPDKVDAINDYSFVGGTGFTSVTIPGSVASIGSKAFSGCSSIKKIYCHATTPPTVEENSFENYNAYLYVPCDNLEDYDLHNVWGNFKHIECLAETATAVNDLVPGAQDGKVRKVIQNGMLYLMRDGILYDTQGRMVR